MTTENKFMNEVFKIGIIKSFMNINPDFTNIDEVFNNNFYVWLLEHSKEKSTIDGKDIDIINNVVQNQSNILLLKKNKAGFSLTKKTFIEEEIKSLKKLDFEKLLFNEKLQFQKYDEFLKSITDDAEGKITSLTLEYYALRLFYEGKQITKDNAKEFLKGTKWNSDLKLYNEFTKWSNRTDRKADPETKIKLKNKIKSFENVITELPEDKREQATDELNILNSYVPKY